MRNCKCVQSALRRSFLVCIVFELLSGIAKTQTHDILTDNRQTNAVRMGYFFSVYLIFYYFVILYYFVFFFKYVTFSFYFALFIRFCVYLYVFFFIFTLLCPDFAVLSNAYRIDSF
jgi:hypothetical protein